MFRSDWDHPQGAAPNASGVTLATVLERTQILDM